MTSLKFFFKRLAKLRISILKGLWSQLVKDTPVLKFAFITFIFYFISIAIVQWTENTINILTVLTLGISINKTWFLNFIYFISQSYDEEVIKALTKRIADWLEKFSIAALLPILVVALRDTDFIKNSGHVVFNASFIALITFFCSLRITKHIAEGVSKICTRAHLRSIIKESEFYYSKFDFDELPSASVKKMIEELNIAIYLGKNIDEELRSILEKQGLIKPAQDSSSKES